MGGKTKVSGKEKEREKEREQQAAKAQRAEDEDWERAGEGKKSKAQAKKEDKDASRQEAAAKKLEAKRLAEEEEAQLSGASKAKPAKVTQHQLLKLREVEDNLTQEQRDKRDLERRRELGEEEYARMIEIENLNRNGDVAEARNVDEALAVLSVAEEAPKMKFSEYQARELPELRAEKPGLKMPQYKDILWKKWLRSPENPLNKPAA